MDEITKMVENINTTINIADKVKMICNLNSMIEVERKQLNNILENNIDEVKAKIPIKYKKMTLDELESEFNNNFDINEKITICSSPPLTVSVIFLIISIHFISLEECFASFVLLHSMSAASSASNADALILSPIKYGVMQL